MIDCQVSIQPLGWLLTFPSNPKVGLVFFSDCEKIAFAKSCNVDLPSEELIYLDPTEIESCADDWYEKACEIRLPF
jgi:hypothetical protein